MLGRGGSGQDDGLVIEEHYGGTSCLAGKTSGFEPDSADAEIAVIDNGFGAVHTLHG
jgi:hypothetical protein